MQGEGFFFLTVVGRMARERRGRRKKNARGGLARDSSMTVGSSGE
jgi:hypothetical protein